MSARKLINLAKDYGANLFIDDGRVRLTAPAPLPDSLMNALRDHKQEIFAELNRKPLARMDWWLQPVEGWPEEITIRSILTGEEITIDLIRRRRKSA